MFKAHMECNSTCKTARTSAKTQPAPDIIFATSKQIPFFALQISTKCLLKNLYISCLISIRSSARRKLLRTSSRSNTTFLHHLAPIRNNIHNSQTLSIPARTRTTNNNSIPATTILHRTNTNNRLKVNGILRKDNPLRRGSSIRRSSSIINHLLRTTISLRTNSKSEAWNIYVNC